MSHKTLIVILGLLLSQSLSAAIVGKEISYRDGATVMKGFLVYDESIKEKRPGVLVVHEWWGHNDYARKRAIMLAELGYTALAVDMYGDGKTASHPQDAGKFSSAVGSNMPLAKARFDAALDTLKKQSTVETDNIAAIGYCFGGGVLLNLARIGLDVDGVVSFHGSLATKSPAHKGDIKTRIRVFNGADDPFVKAEQIAALKEEMEQADVDFKFVNYPGAKHSFTNPGSTAIGKEFGIPLEYNAAADEDSWKQMLAFFREIFSR